MREGWIETTLDGIADVVMGQSPDGKTYNQEGHGLPFMQGSAEFGEHNPIPEMWCSDPKKIAEPGDLLLSVRAPVGDTNFADQRIAIGRGLSIIRAKKGSMTEFIRLVIQLNVAELIASSGSGMFASITGKNLKEFKVNLPPLPEQKRIVDLISSVDSYIEALQQQLGSTKSSRNAVLHELLTADGDDWTETTLGEVVSVVNGGTPSTKNEDYWGGSIVWITTTELTAFDGKRVNSSKRTITADGLSNGPARLVRSGTTLVGTTATIGTCALADCELTFNQQISGLIPMGKNLDDYYLFYWIQHIKSILEGLSAGTSFKRISTSVLKTVSINFPPIGEQKRIASVISEMDEFIDSIQRTLIQARNLRSGLLSDLLSGEHEIPSSYDKVMGAA